MNYLRVGRAVEFSSFNDTPERSEVNLRGDECSSPNEEVRGDGEGHGVALAWRTNVWNFKRRSERAQLKFGQRLPMVAGERCVMGDAEERRLGLAAKLACEFAFLNRTKSRGSSGADPATVPGSFRGADGGALGAQRRNDSAHGAAP